VPVIDFGTGGSGAPTNASYITATPNASLSAEQALSLLGTGLLKNSTGTGVLSIAVAADVPDLSSLYLTPAAAAAAYQPLGSYATLTGAETLTNKTLTTPTIASFANAAHSHLNAAGGGTITAAAISDLATAAVAFSNKTGGISQWTNDSGYVLPTVTTLSSLVSIGTITTGTWTATVVAGQYGGTGIANTGKTITLGGNLTTSGAFATTLTVTAATGVTLPTTGTLATLAGAEAFTNKTGNISQWTNDASYTTLAAVAGVGYLTSVTAHNVLSATHGDTLTASVVRGDLVIGNSTPKWARLAVGAANAVLSSDGTDIAWQASTGTGNNVRATSPALTTPDIGVATATSVNKLAITAPATSATLVIADGKTFTVNQTLTLTGTTGTTMTFPATSATLARTDAAQTFTGDQTFSAQILARVGSYNNVGYGFTGVANTGLYYSSGILFDVAGNVSLIIGSTSVLLPGCPLGFCAGGASTADLIVARSAAAVLQLGADLNGAAISQILQSANGITGADRTGGNFTIASGKGTGAGAVSSLFFQTPAVLGAGSTAQSLVTRLTLTEAMATFSGAVTVTGAATLSSTLAANGNVTFGDAINVITNGTTGTKLMTATSQKCGLWNVTPIVQPAAAGQAAITDSTGGIAASSLVDVGVVFSQAAINANFATVAVLLSAIRTAMVAFGSMKGSA
jgi:hypothetical protein